jgi:chemotaxis protein CheC
MTSNAVVAPPLARALLEAVCYAGDQLASLIEGPIQLRGTQVERIRLEDLPGLRQGEDRLVTAVHLEFSGPFSGHVILSFTPEVAAGLASRLLMEEVRSDRPLDELASSALGEMGNIATAAFLTSIANAVHYTVHPCPPTVIQDMIGALLSNVVLELALESTHALLVQTTFQVSGETLQGELILLPTNHSCEALESRLSQCSPQQHP